MDCDSNSNNFNQDDNLLDDLMNIVQTDTTKTSQLTGHKSNKERTDSANTSNDNPEDDEENDEFNENDDYDDDEEEILIDEMLEKPIDILDEKDEVNFYTYNKIQIKNIYWRGCQDTILPEGWVQVTHACGMPLFLNRQSRVCTMSRPYYIGQSSARKHDIPISSIPCLAYKRRKETVEKQIKEHNQNKVNGKCPYSSSVDTTVKIAEPTNTNESPNKTNDCTKDIKTNKKIVVSIQSNEEKLKESILTPEQIHEYCKKLFEFDIIKVKKFKTWGDRKKFMRKSKQKKFPENAKMLKIQTKTQKGINKEFNINMTNKTGLCILYEYASQVYKTNPRFEIQEKENPKDPFQAICYLNEKICGKGTGNSKKAAKNNAAEAALCVLIPDFKGQVADTQKNNDDMYSFFDGFNVEHTHVYSHSQKLGSPMPYDVLLTCLKYNFAINMSRNRKQFIEEEIKPIKYRNCLYKMKLAQYEVEVNCTKKKEGRQLAAQKILKLMHPHIETWGSMLRLYGSRMAESFLKMENQNENENIGIKSTNNIKKSEKNAEIVNNHDKNVPTENQSTSNVTSANGTSSKIANQKAKPNRELLEKLKEEMRKLKKPTTDPAISDQNEISSTLNSQKTEIETNFNLNNSTILTIQPLLLGNDEFKLSSSNYLMSEHKDTPSDSNTPIENDGKIMFTDSLLEKNCFENNCSMKKRKFNSEDEYEEENGQHEDSDSDDEDDDDDDDDDDEEGSDSGENDSQSD